MNILKRLTTTVATSFDWVITQVENHEALVDSALGEMHQAAVKARVQLGRVQKDGRAMAERLELAHDAERSWNDRALKVAKSDEKRALECIKRRNQTKREISAIETQFAEHQKLERQLVSDLKVIDERIDELKRKKNAFTARQYRAEALQKNRPDEIGMMQGIDDLFERWELKLAQCEVCAQRTDSFEEQFLNEEEDSLLKAELAELIGKQDECTAQ